MPPKSSPPTSQLVQGGLTALGYIVLSYAAWVWSTTMFENMNGYSTRSYEEQITTFESENSYYYSFYDDVVTAPNFLEAMNRLLYSKTAEAPLIVNTLERFNVYQELFFGMIYRVLNFLSLAPNNPLDLYVMSVYVLFAFGACGFFTIGWITFGSALGGFIGCGFYVGNHFWATRVWSHPPLREQFAIPLLYWQVACLTGAIVTHKSKPRMYKWCLWGISFFTTSMILFWQFTQFIIFVQVVALVGIQARGWLTVPTAKRLLYALALGAFGAMMGLFFNLFLLHSLMWQCIISAVIVLNIPASVVDDSSWIKKALIHGTAFVVTAVTVRTVITVVVPGAAEGAHIFDVLGVLLGIKEPNFHTVMYTSSAEFNFLTAQQLDPLIWNGVIPLGILSVVLLAIIGIFGLRATVPGVDPEVTEARVVAQLMLALCAIAFGCMGYMLMRFIALGTPFACLILAQVLDGAIWRAFLPAKFFLSNQPAAKQQKQSGGRRAAQKSGGMFANIPLGTALQVGLAVILVSWPIYWNSTELVQHYRNGRPNPDMAVVDLFKLTEYFVPEDSRIACDIQTCGRLKLGAHRAVVVHPQYENLELREKVRRVYGMFGHQSPEEVLETMRALNATHFVLSMSCFASMGSDRVQRMVDNHGVIKVKTEQSFCDVARSAPQFELLFEAGYFHMYRVKEDGEGPSEPFTSRIRDGPSREADAYRYCGLASKASRDNNEQDEMKWMKLAVETSPETAPCTCDYARKIEDMNKHEAKRLYLLALKHTKGTRRTGCLANLSVFIDLVFQDMPLADNYYRMAVETAPWDATIRANYGSYLAAVQRWDDAYPQFEAGLETWKGTGEEAHVKCNYGVLVQNNSPRKAMRYIEEAMVANKEDPCLVEGQKALNQIKDKLSGRGPKMNAPK